MKCIFSVDVEDWYHILDLPSTPELTAWDSFPSHIERNFEKLLDLFEEKHVQITCFFLGWIAEKYPELVKMANERGHEIASHGYSHRLVYEMTEEDFFNDAVKSREIIENITGQPVLGFRSAGFSTTENTPWLFDKLIEAGYLYDSSVFPAPRKHGGVRTNSFAPYFAGGSEQRIVEFPITVAKLLGKSFCFFGGGYLRLFPYFLIKRMASKVISEGRPVVFYIHPREIDPRHPRLPMNAIRYFKSYVNLSTTEDKISRILGDFEFTTFEHFMTDHPELIKDN